MRLCLHGWRLPRSPFKSCAGARNLRPPYRRSAGARNLRHKGSTQRRLSRAAQVLGTCDERMAPTSGEKRSFKSCAGARNLRQRDEQHQELRRCSELATFRPLLFFLSRATQVLGTCDQARCTSHARTIYFQELRRCSELATVRATQARRSPRTFKSCAGARNLRRGHPVASALSRAAQVLGTCDT